MINEKFSAFIMTYEREVELEKTINKLFEQTVQPSKILIVDNSFSFKTKELIGSLKNSRIEYFRVGNNSGPAGASHIGLKVLSDLGYDWIYWGDDDDPPRRNDLFEKLLNEAEKLKDCGCIGVVGHKFNNRTASFVRTPDSLILDDGILEVDGIGGGMTKIVNGNMIREKGILPDKDFFYGFEELDFDFKIKSVDYKLYVPKKIFRELRIQSGNFGEKKKKESYPIWRQYYSNRNLLFILKKNKLYVGFLLVTLKSLLKIVLELRKGFPAFKKSFYYNGLAVVHGYLGIKGLKVLPVSKTLK